MREMTSSRRTLTVNRLGMPKKSPIAFLSHVVGYASTNEEKRMRMKVGEHSETIFKGRIPEPGITIFPSTVGCIPTTRSRKPSIAAV